MDSFSGKRVVVMGLGLHGGGLATVKFLLREKANKILITDLKSRERLKETLAKIPEHHSIRYRLGQHQRRDFRQVDYVIKNPDVPRTSPYVAYARRSRVRVISDIGIFFHRVQTPIIGVTGTKGKSTTTAMIAAVLAAKFKRVLYGGNIRRSVLEIVDEANQADVVVLELSSFQLEDLALEKKSPQVAVITMIAPDHLNRHGTYANYKRIKNFITKFQTSRDLLLIPDEAQIRRLTSNTKAKVLKVAVSEKLRETLRTINPNIDGHMANAAALALAVGKRYGVPETEALGALGTFKMLEGRRETVRRLKGITFVNDTTATAPTAAAADLAWYAKRGRVILIAGGMDKKLPYKEFARKIARNAAGAVLLPGSGTKKILRNLPQTFRSRVTMASSMTEAVQAAYQLAQRGDTVLLAPGGASFNMFKHEFHRGAEFVKAVKRLS